MYYASDFVEPIFVFDPNQKHEHWAIEREQKLVWSIVKRAHCSCFVNVNEVLFRVRTSYTIHVRHHQINPLSVHSVRNLCVLHVCSHKRNILLHTYRRVSPHRKRQFLFRSTFSQWKIHLAFKRFAGAAIESPHSIGAERRLPVNSPARSRHVEINVSNTEPRCVTTYN